jgi:hypothetical protein
MNQRDGRCVTNKLGPAVNVEASLLIPQEIFISLLQSNISSAPSVERP